MQSPTNASGTITIRSGHTVNVSANVTADQTVVESNGQVIIDAGFVLTLGSGTGEELTVNTGGILTNNGTFALGGTFPPRTALINGTFNNNGTVSGASSSKLRFGAGSDYYHLFSDGGTIPSAHWDQTSTVNITGLGSGAGTAPLNLNQTGPFGNFVWDTPAFDSFIDLQGAPAIISGDFIVNSTGAGSIVYNFSGGNNSLTIGGDLQINGGFVAYTAFIGSAGTLTINNSLTPGKGLKITGGLFQLADDDNLTVNCKGLVSIQNGDLELASTTASTTFNVSGDFSHLSGNLYSTSGTNTLNFNGTSRQTFTSSIEPIGSVNYVVPLNATLSIPGTNNFISSGGTLTVSGTLEVGSTNPAGALQTGSSAGNVRVMGTRTYNPASTIVYNGTGGQFIGNGHPTIEGVNTTINNASGVSLIVGTPIIITTDLTLLDGNLNIGNGALTLDGNLIAGDNNITIGSGGSITISGNGSIGTFPFPSGAQTFTNFTLDNPNGVTFDNDVTITGVVTMTNGSLAFPGRALALNGTFASTGSGDLSPSSTSTLTIGGSGAFGTLRINPSNNTVGTLNFSRSDTGTATLNSTLVVTNAFNLTNGDFSNVSGLRMSNGSTLTRNSNAELLDNAPIDLTSGETYNVRYTGSGLTTGLELPGTASDMLGSLTINGGPVTLDKNIRVHSNVELLNSNLNANGFDITMLSASGSWNKTNGSFTGGTGTVVIAGNIQITSTSTPSFTNITTNSGSTLTMPATNINIAGNLQLNTSSTFNNNGGTITLNGTGNQVLAGTGKSFKNITVNKTGGFVDITPSVNLTGVFTIQTPTEVKANGNLTLISTSDAATGNASIAEIPTGGSITGDVIVQRRMSGEGRIYRDISSPVQSGTVQQIMNSGITVTGFTGSSYPCAGCGTNNPSMYSYTESVGGDIRNGYTAVTSASQVLTPGKGYNVLVRDEIGQATMSLRGPINSGPINFNSSGLISYTNSGNSGDGWNFVGNPYPSSVDWDNGWTKSNIQGNMISIWDAGANQYKTWNGSVGSLGSGVIAQGQGFWFQASGTPGLSVTEDSKVSSTGAFYRKSSEEVHFIELVLSGEGVEDRTYLQQVKGATPDFDNMDGPKLAFEGFSLATVIRGDRQLAINAIGAIPESAEIPLTVSNIKEGTYQFSGNLAGDFTGVEVSIFDNFTNSLHSLSEAFTFNVTNDVNSKDADRFVLVLGNFIRAEVASLVTVYPNPVKDHLYVYVSSIESPAAEIFDATGQSVGSLSFERDPSTNKWVGAFDTSSQSAGLFMVKVSVLNGVEVIKFIKY